MENENWQKEMMDAVVLAGGMGTRLRPVVQDIPKPMAPIGERPFLSFILDELYTQGVRRVVLSTGYRHEVVEDYFSHEYNGLEIAYSVEDSPLGTGGAIKKALKNVNTPHAIVLNGDTMFKARLQEMKKIHLQNSADITLALKHMDDCERYGVVETSEGRIQNFGEKRANTAGAINGGIYMLRTTLLEEFNLPEKFSFEKDFLEAYNKNVKMMAYPSNGYFIDIGIPDDYARAQQDLLALP